ncbi:hypothetical protein K435DRAFT_965788 [Dendrothele bispora CBS 962.96]|uniref:DUF3844 domain-containing protein n=1 Tax=Dendrothele bispora (strain CBS 962.96) TaxID=1314807 RepID=A0A4S8M3R2_DENBC|nr:hypothetical protein K435DRAFT_965788 [Dendrothele bispora CBS 962.96]
MRVSFAFWLLIQLGLGLLGVANRIEQRFIRGRLIESRQDSGSNGSAGGAAPPQNLTVPDGCNGDACVNFVNTTNICRERERQGKGSPACGCTQENLANFTICQNCVVLEEVTARPDASDASNAASVSQQQLNLFFVLCNDAIKANSALAATMAPLQSPAISIPNGRGDIIISTTPISIPTGAASGPSPGSTDTPGSSNGTQTTPGSSAPPNSAQNKMSRKNSWLNGLVVQSLIFGSAWIIFS